jgi:hypothetical protein
MFGRAQFREVIGFSIDDSGPEQIQSGVIIL